MHRRCVQLLLAGLVLLAAVPAPACRYSVRDTGFVDLDQPPWRLQLRGFDEAQTRRWTQLVTPRLADSNLRLASADAATTAPGDAPTATPGPTASPAVVLLDPHGRSLVLAEGPAVPSSDAALAGFLEQTLLTPIREQLHRELLHQFAVLLLIEGSDRAATAAARESAEAAIRAFIPQLPKLPKPFAQPPKLVPLALDQLAAERLLVWSLGLDPAPAAAPRVAVLYGRGRLMGPALEGPLITRTTLQQRLTLVGQDCECDLDRVWLQGPVFPARWDAARQEDAARRLGFDPENPLVRSEVTRIVFRAPTPGATPRSRASATDPLALGYREESADAPDTDDPAEPAPTNAPTPSIPGTPSAATATASSESSSASAAPDRSAWWLLAAAAGAVVAVGAFLALKILRAR